nr:hypothetical protein [Tanacetum cinerariifolium]
MPTPSPSPLTPLSPPSAGERLALIDAVTAVIPSPPLPPPLYIPPLVDSRDDIPEIEMPPRKREVEYGIRDTWVDPAKTVPEIAPMTVGEVNPRVTELAKLHEHDTQDLYALLEDAQDSRTHISQRVDMDSQRVDLLMEDRIAHQETIQIVEEEAYAAREAWAHSIRLSQAVHSELQNHQEQVRIMALVTDKLKKDKFQAKPDKTEHKTKSVEKSTVKGQQKVKPDKIEAKRNIKVKETKEEGLNLPLYKVVYKEGGEK